jgi:transposase
VYRSPRRESSTKVGRHRWVVERNISWLLRLKRLGLRYDRTKRTLAPLPSAWS